MYPVNFDLYENDLYWNDFVLKQPDTFSEWVLLSHLYDDKFNK